MAWGEAENPLLTEGDNVSYAEAGDVTYEEAVGYYQNPSFAPVKEPLEFA